jgi:hypothetical protein
VRLCVSILGDLTLIWCPLLLSSISRSSCHCINCHFTCLRIALRSRTSPLPTTFKSAMLSTFPIPPAVTPRGSSRRLRCRSSSVLSTGGDHMHISYMCGGIDSGWDSLMMNGRNNGKKLLAVRIVAHAFEIIHLLSDQNPIQVRSLYSP